MNDFFTDKAHYGKGGLLKRLADTENRLEAFWNFFDVRPPIMYGKTQSGFPFLQLNMDLLAASGIPFSFQCTQSVDKTTLNVFEGNVKVAGSEPTPVAGISIPYVPGNFVWITATSDDGGTTWTWENAGSSIIQNGGTPEVESADKRVFRICYMDDDGPIQLHLGDCVVWPEGSGGGGGGGTVPIGTICMWHGALDDIPAGWVVCDGNNGTPPLSQMFPVAADGSYYPVGSTGGHKWHGVTENNHNDHVLTHTHEYTINAASPPVSCLTQNVTVAAPGGPYSTSGATWTGSDTTPSLTAEWQLTPDSGDLAKHHGYYNGGTDTDNRPPYYAIVFMMYVGT